MKNIKLLLIIFVSIVFINSCEDAPPVDYVNYKYLEAFLIIDQPIENIMLMNSQPVNSPFEKEKALIKDADVKLLINGISHNLIYRDGDNPGYYYPDTDLKIQPNTEYDIIINTKDGGLITAKTITPNRIGGWVKPPKPIAHYPQDTLKLPRVDSLEIEWEATQGASLYLIRTIAMDTLNYGRYLETPTEEPNRRTYSLLTNFENTGVLYKNKSSWNLIANNKTPTVWLAFKWFGPYEVEVYNPDPNMMNWFVNLFFTGSSENIDLLNSVNGGIGVFGSASKIDGQTFIMKNQP
ncbi:MAG: DUF4249 family protein [Candidatus Kapabacteria bacterium]|nr:DUF4249 family protein [Ignavibacteriota bacterium]MCW5884249.1 DUF4249 family protein [Candidatus Kapabacteria bacterium]